MVFMQTIQKFPPPCPFYKSVSFPSVRLSDGTGEWRQLLLDMQEIIDWLVRADQELSSQKPIGGDIETVQQQNENHQVRGIPAYSEYQISLPVSYTIGLMRTYL